LLIVFLKYLLITFGLLIQMYLFISYLLFFDI